MIDLRGLQERAAELFEKEAAIFVPTGRKAGLPKDKQWILS
jgi:threonine aldolase